VLLPDNQEYTRCVDVYKLIYEMVFLRFHSEPVLWIPINELNNLSKWFFNDAYDGYPYDQTVRFSGCAPDPTESQLKDPTL